MLRGTHTGHCAVLFVRLLVGASVGACLLCLPSSAEDELASGREADTLALPQPRRASQVSVEEALARRRSVRQYPDEPLTLAEVSQLLWAAQGITSERGYRTAPSAGALYPLEVYVVAGNVADLPDGIYRYRSSVHGLIKVAEGDKRGDLCAAARGQASVRDAAAVIVFAAVYERTTAKYGERGIRYVHIEVGHAAQNVFLQAVALDLGAVVVGAFSDEAVKRVVNMNENEQPLYLMPVGKK